MKFSIQFGAPNFKKALSQLGFSDDQETRIKMEIYNWSWTKDYKAKDQKNLDYRF